MKKLIIIILFVAFPLMTKAQLTGSGTFTDPWSGTMSGDATWSGTVYINGDIIVDNEKLTINPGTLVIFLAEAADLIITGTGQIEANGTTENMIRFTADDNNNGVFGETGERWGHISFEGTTGSSVINYCIIEFGLKSGAGIEGYGGGIHINTSNLTVSNSEIRDNRASFGGGIFVNQNVAPVLYNCKIINNQSASSGGGLYLWIGSSPTITNCIISNNRSLGGGGGGGVFLGRQCQNVRIINTIIVNNTAAGSGKNIHLYINTDTEKPSFINCIIWSPANSITYTTQTPSPTDFINCAIQSPIAGSTTDCITLNASNTAVDGPNFTAIDGSDWSIQYVSPCRDAGVDSYPGVTIPLLDYAGNSRVLTTDIGAFEVQYVPQSIWKITAGSTDWNSESNWDGNVPSSSIPLIIIPSGAAHYPTATPAPDFTIGTGSQMILNPGAKVTLGSLTNNGTLLLESDDTGISSLIVNSFSGNDATIEIYLTGGGDKTTYKWHYISTPVSSLPVSIFAPGTTLDVAQWVESLPTGSLREGWVAYDGWIYSDGALGGPTFSNLIPGKGYNYYHQTDHLYTFSGQLNCQNVAVVLGYTNINPVSYRGFNLLGNPFSSGLDWNYIINDVSYPSNTSKGLYFTRDNVQCTYAGGVGIPSDVTGIIPPMQGFFSKTYSIDNTINLTPAARVQDNIHPRYKGTSIIPLVRLSFQDNGQSDETVVRFDADAKTDLDYDFDALKMFIDPESPYIYSSTDNIQYAINGQPFPGEDEEFEFPIVVNLITDGNHSLNATQVQGLDNYIVKLTDNTTSLTADLKTTTAISFTASAGIITDRFVLKISKIATGIENPVTSPDNFNIYQSYNLINIQPLSDEWNGKTGSVRVFDLTGKPVSYLQNAEFRTNTVLQIQAPTVKGLYMVEVRSGAMRHVGKVVVR